ncbi:MAG: hypothetical protein QW561_03065 [Candidatus Aenigmatarchaeota archaeon]
MARKNGKVTIKVVIMGKEVSTYTKEAPITVGDLLDELGVNGQMEVRINGVEKKRGEFLADGDVMLLVPKIRGG